MHESRAGVSVGRPLLTGNVQTGFPNPDKEGSLLETERGTSEVGYLRIPQKKHHESLSLRSRREKAQ